jgi:hypothetical protein
MAGRRIVSIQASSERKAAYRESVPISCLSGLSNSAAANETSDRPEKRLFRKYAENGNFANFGAESCLSRFPNDAAIPDNHDIVSRPC